MAGPCHQRGRTQQALLMQVVLQMLALEHRVSVGPLDDMSMDLLEHIMEYSWNINGLSHVSIRFQAGNMNLHPWIHISWIFLGETVCPCVCFTITYQDFLSAFR